MSSCQSLFLASFLLTACGSAASSGDAVTEPSPAAPAPAPTAPAALPTSTASPTAQQPQPPAPMPTATAPAVLTKLAVLTYNVAGLPQGLSSSNPQQNMPQISPKLNPYDLALVQEDFAFHAQLTAAATHPHKSTPMVAPGFTDLGDGLNAFSRAPFSQFSRTKWQACNGTFDQKNDCLTSKGFSRFVLDAGQGHTIDVYDVHFDAGRTDADAAARDLQAAQLVQAIAAQSAGKAVVVAGDTNMKASDETTLQTLLTGAGLTCSCRALACTETGRVDRVMFRSSSSVKLSAKSYQVLAWVDAQGEPLSDHEPVSVELAIGP